MKSYRLFQYFVRRALRLMAETPLLTMVTTGIIAATLFLLSSFLLVVVDLDHVLQTWGRGIRVVVFLKKGFGPEGRQALYREISNRKEVEHLEFISKEKALERLRNMLEDSPAILEDLARENPLPESFALDLHEEARSGAALRSFVVWLNGQSGVSEVTYGREWVERFEEVLRGLKAAGIFLTLTMTLFCGFIISNTIKVALYARREELQILKLVGATDGFLAMPFMLQGGAQGLFGAAIALLLSAGLHGFALRRLGRSLVMADLPFLPPVWIMILLGGGVLLGAMGSLLSVLRFAKE